MSSLDLQDVGRDFSFSLCAMPLVPRFQNEEDGRLEIRVLE